MRDETLTLLLEHRDFVQRLARRLCSDRDDACDLVQDVWSAALAARDDPRRPRRWLAGVARNLALERRRSTTRRLARERAWARAEPIDSPARFAEFAETSRLLTQALSRLPARHREVLLLRYYEGLPPRRIAARTGESVAAVKSRLRRGLARLRKELDASCGGDRQRWRALLLPVSGGRLASGMLTPALAALAILGSCALVWILAPGGGVGSAPPVPPPSVRAANPPPAQVVTTIVRAPSRLLGVARDVDTGRPFAGVEVAGGDGGTARTGEDGLFDLLLVGPGEKRVSIRAPEGFRIVAVSPSDPQAGGRLEVLVEVPSPVGTIQLRDARTGERLPHFACSLQTRDGSCEACTDGDGLMRVRVDTSGTTLLRSLEPDRGRDPAPVLLERSATGLLGRVPTGPTYQVNVHPSELGVSDLEARLVAADERRAHATAFAPLRSGPVPWVRFGPETRRLEGAGPWRLEVRDRQGHWIGHVPVSRIVGVHPHILPVDLELRGALQGRATDRARQPVDQAWVRLLPLEAEGDSRETVTVADGSFRLGWVAPGLYKVALHSPRHLVVDCEILVIAGVTAELLLEPAPLPDLTSVLGVLEGFGAAQSSRAEEDAHLVLRSLDDPLRTFMWDVAPATGADTPFALDGVPPGHYALTVHSPHFGRFTPSSLDIRVPGDDIRIRRIRGPEVDGEMRVSLLGMPVPRFSVFVRLDGRDDPATTKVREGSGGRLVLERLPANAEVAWTVRAPGCIPVRGRAPASALAGQPLEIALEAGWGNRLIVRDPEGHAVANLLVALDGEPAGVTDESGRVWLQAPRPPRTIQLGAPPIAVVGGDLFADGSFRDLIWGIEAVVPPMPQAGPSDLPPPEHGEGR